MKITRCKLLRKQQLKLLEYFVLEVTARSAADILEIQPNTAMLFYRKIRQVIPDSKASAINCTWITSGLILAVTTLAKRYGRTFQSVPLTVPQITKPAIGWLLITANLLI